LDNQYYYVYLGIVFLAIIIAVGFTYSGKAIVGSGVTVYAAHNPNDCGYLVSKVVSPSSLVTFSEIVEAGSTQFFSLNSGIYTLVFQPTGKAPSGLDCFNLYEEQIKIVRIEEKMLIKTSVDFVYNPAGQYDFKIGVTKAHCSAVIMLKKVYNDNEIWLDLGTFSEGKNEEIFLAEGVNYLKFVPRGDENCLNDYQEIDKVIKMSSNGLIQEDIIFSLRERV